jgi:hypothetical protein
MVSPTWTVIDAGEKAKSMIETDAEAAPAATRTGGFTVVVVVVPVAWGTWLVGAGVNDGLVVNVVGLAPVGDA